ncbi:hypothetical protein CEXT_165441 [Caerostris extrusa]|uniref:Uncharacterized protein n=1 Tax=Caerostris extrusa TaxID=172846 RepID=A0AAV4QTE9_CAEEX|nr:hypothetical protein CEXT_165441 [Caerostris extrusa]
MPIYSDQLRQNSRWLPVIAAHANTMDGRKDLSQKKLNLSNARFVHRTFSLETATFQTFCYRDKLEINDSPSRCIVCSTNESDDNNTSRGQDYL